MSWLAMYLDEDDVGTLASWLNDQEEIAFIVSAGWERWKAVKRLDRLPDGDYQIWHTPSGPLPLLSRDPAVPDGIIADPWDGWTGRCQGVGLGFLGTTDGGVEAGECMSSGTPILGVGCSHPAFRSRPAKPFFGPGCPGIIDLRLQTRPLIREEGVFEPVSGTWTWRRVVDERTIGVSSFGWIGNHYRVIGHPAHPSTGRWWKRLRRWVASLGEKIPRSGSLSGPRPEIHAFPGALRAIHDGWARSYDP